MALTFILITMNAKILKVCLLKHIYYFYLNTWLSSHSMYDGFIDLLLIHILLSNIKV